jgi:hypothetical protein
MECVNLEASRTEIMSNAIQNDDIRINLTAMPIPTHERLLFDSEEKKSASNGHISPSSFRLPFERSNQSKDNANDEV